MTYSYTDTITFTVTHARHLASKIVTDLKRIQRFYDSPSDAEINDYEAEAIELMKAGYLGCVTYGFKRNGKWVEPTLIYTSRDLAGMTSDDDDPGRVFPGADISGAAFSSFLTYSQAWWDLSEAERVRFKNGLPIRLTPGTEPGVDGYLIQDKTYSSGGRALDRTIVRGNRW